MVGVLRYGTIAPSKVYSDQRAVAVTLARFRARVKEFRPVRNGDYFIGSGKKNHMEYVITQAMGPYEGVSPRLIVELLPSPKMEWWQ